MTRSTLVRAGVIGFIAAIAAAVVQRLLLGDISPAVTGGVGGAVAVVVTMVTSRKAESGE